MNEKIWDALTVGELNVDLLLNEIDSFPEMGKEKLADKMDLTLGSSSAIFASNLSSLGAKVAFCGKIGKDGFGDLVVESLNNKGVETDTIIRDENLNTGITVILNYDEDRAMVTHPGAMNYLTLSDVTEEMMNKAKHLHFSSFFLQPGMKDGVAEMFEKAKRLGLSTSLDPQWDPAEEWDFDFKNILPNVDVFLPNEVELLSLTKAQSIKEGIEKLKPFVNLLVVKRGNKGSLLYSNGELNEAPPFLNTNVVDAIGAGDSFDAGFILKFIQGAAAVECQKFGNLTGAVNTTAAGGTGAFDDFKTVMQIAKEKFSYGE
ncbi:MAG: carbohydrate kinase family protein [Chlorobi bacterium]|nr:carbohydrate kinase family protein [Chlorobiota bacterium]